jgi:hypothetical protein
MPLLPKFTTSKKKSYSLIFFVCVSKKVFF